MARKQKESQSSGGKEYICPYCFSRVDLGHVHHLCSGQTCAKTFAATVTSTRNSELMKYVSRDGQNEIDPEKSLFYGRSPEGPDAVIAKQHIIRNSSGLCDVCKRPVYTRVCPVCHNLIPPGAEEDGNRIFVILGPKGVGKSHYIAVLINQLKNSVSSEFDGVLNAATDGTTLKYRDMYYRRLFEEKRKLLPTKSYDVSDESREPLIYYLRMFDADSPKVFTFAFFDTAGEDLTSSDRMMSLSLNSFISKAAGLVYLVDPLQARYINQRIRVDNKPEVGPDESDMLNYICQTIRTNKKIKAKDKIDIPIAVCISLVASYIGISSAGVTFPRSSRVISASAQRNFSITARDSAGSPATRHNTLTYTL